MEIETVKIKELKALPSNAKIHPPEQISRIAQSIKSFGFRIPVTITKDNFIIAGHGRVAAAESLGMEEIPAIRTEYTGKQAEAIALNIADNTVVGTEYDEELLSETIEALDYELGEMIEVMETKEIQSEVQKFDNILTRAIQTGEEITTQETSDAIAEKFSDKIKDIATQHPQEMSRAQAIVIPQAKGNEVIIITDPALKDFIDELKRYKAAGAKSPLSEILNNIYPLRWT